MDYTSKVTLKAIGEFIKSKIPDVSKFLLKTEAVPRALGFGYGTCSTAAATTAKIASISGTNTPKFISQNGGIISIKFTNAVPAKSTLNVNSGGAKTIFYHGKNIVDGIISAGDTATFIMISNVYHVIAVENGHTVKADVPADAVFTPPDLSGYASKELYGDTTINVGRKAGSTVGEYSTAEGGDTTASGTYSHAEGVGSVAEGQCSHAEGYHTYATNYAHAESQGIANGWGSHAEGSGTANGELSHASGFDTIANNKYEAAYGAYNASNEDTLFSVGDGTSDNARHNAFEITKTGGSLHNKNIATTDLIPTSLPANGGNADTVNGRAGWRIPTLNENGALYSASAPNVNDACIQWNAAGKFFCLKMLGGNLTAVDVVKQSLIGTSGSCQYNTILAWANAQGGNAFASIIAGDGIPSDAPYQQEAMLQVQVDYYNQRKIVTWTRYLGGQAPQIRQRAIFSGTWNDDDWRVICG